MAALCLCASAAVGPAHAQTGEQEFAALDPDRSVAAFRVRALWLVPVEGHFSDVEGRVLHDPFRNRLRVRARIRVESLQLQPDSRRAWALSPEFFDAARAPWIEFTSEPFPRRHLAEGGVLPGRLTLRGISQPVQFTVLPAFCRRVGEECPLQLEGAIRRSAFGLGPAGGAMGDRVDLNLAVFTRRDGQVPSLTRSSGRD